MGATGIWIGLAAGISATAVFLTVRFFVLSRRELTGVSVKKTGSMGEGAT